MLNFYDTSSASPLDIRTIRFQYTVTSQDIDNEVIHLTIPWGVAFRDANYTCDQNIAIISSPQGVDTALDLYFVAGFSKTATGFTISIGIDGVAGDVIELHAIGIHD